MILISSIIGSNWTIVKKKKITFICLLPIYYLNSFLYFKALNYVKNTNHIKHKPKPNYFDSTILNF